MDPITATIVAYILTATGVGSVASALGQVLTQLRQRRTANIQGTLVESPEQRIDRLVESLSEAADAAQEIEDEIRKRQDLARKLQEDIQKYEQLKEVNQEEVEAVARVLGGELRKEGRRTFWTGFLLNFVFFVLGVGTTVILSLLFGL